MTTLAAGTLVRRVDRPEVTGVVQLVWTRHVADGSTWGRPVLMARVAWDGRRYSDLRVERVEPVEPAL